MQLTEPQAGSDVGALRTRAERAGDGTYRITGRRSSSPMASTISPTTSSTSCWRACPTRRPARGHLAVPGAEVLRQRRRLARRAQRRALPFGRAQARHPRLADLHDGVRRQRRRDRLAGRRGEPRAQLHVHDDEQCAARGRPAGRRASPSAPRSRRLPMRASAGRAAPAATEGADHRASGRAAHAADDAGADARGARDLLCDRRGDRPRASRARTTRRARPADERASLLTPVAKAFSTDIGIEVASLGVQVHGGMGFIEETGAAQHLSRCAHRADLRGHQRHPGDRSRHAQAAAGGRRGGARLSGRAAPDRGGREGRERSGVRRDRCAAGRRRRQPRSRDHMAARQARNRRDAALAGATPYLRLFASAAGGCVLAEEALAGIAPDGSDAAAASRSRASLPRTSPCRRAGWKRP